MHYKLYLHWLNMDAMIATRQFEEPVRVQAAKNNGGQKSGPYAYHDHDRDRMGVSVG